MADGQITRETFQGYDVDSKLDTLYDFAADTSRRLGRLEKKHLFDRGISAIAGFFGGIIAVLGKTVLRW